MGKSSPQTWSGWSAALSKCLEAAGGEMEWSDLQAKLVKRYTKEVGSVDDGAEEALGNAALACIPESYLSKEDSVVRLPKRSQDNEDEDDAPKAKKSKTEVKGDAETGVEKSGEASLKVFIKGLPYAVDADTLRKDFAECGEITQLQLPMNEEGKPKGFAFITYASKEGVDAALKFDNTDYGGRFIGVSPANDKGKDKGKGKGKEGKAGDWECPNCGDNVFARNAACRQCGTARPGGVPAGSGAGEQSVNTVFIRGLPFSVTEEALRKDFAECGEIERLKMPMNEEGRPKGIAFISYSSEEAMAAAIKFDNTDYGGRTINVVKAEPGGGKGKDGKGKGKDGKDKGKGKDGKDKGKKGKGKGKATSEAKAKNTGCIVEGAGEKKTFEDSDDE